MPDAMALARALERERAILIRFVTLVRERDAWALQDLKDSYQFDPGPDGFLTLNLADEIISKFPLDRILKA